MTNEVKRHFDRASTTIEATAMPTQRKLKIHVNTKIAKKATNAFLLEYSPKEMIDERLLCFLPLAITRTKLAERQPPPYRIDLASVDGHSTRTTHPTDKKSRHDAQGFYFASNLFVAMIE